MNPSSFLEMAVRRRQASVLDSLETYLPGGKKFNMDDVSQSQSPVPQLRMASLLFSAKGHFLHKIGMTSSE